MRRWRLGPDSEHHKAYYYSVRLEIQNITCFVLSASSFLPNFWTQRWQCISLQTLDMLNLYISLCCQFKGALCRFKEEIRSPEHSQKDDYSVCDFNQIRKESLKCPPSYNWWRMEIRWLVEQDGSHCFIIKIFHWSASDRSDVKLQAAEQRLDVWMQTVWNLHPHSPTRKVLWSLTHNQTVIAPPCALDSNLTANVLKDYANFGVFRIYRIHFRGSCFMWAVATPVH